MFYFLAPLLSVKYSLRTKLASNKSTEVNQGKTDKSSISNMRTQARYSTF